MRKDETFFQLVLARLVEPTSELDSLHVIEALGLQPVHLSTVKRALQRCASRDYREQLAAASFTHVWNQPCRDVSLLLFDVITLYFEAEKEIDAAGLRFIVGSQITKAPHDLAILPQARGP
ncbi:hypothetical protein [uncultured Tessaracoccus sp.]|uniref:hypothetical protein n=1 Tax=uncultured Tessaracoccus sp. TaxID=905023 RepID=UPI00261920D5|nr:hypothetical protein [uncultured Tessaracoccus sp.]